ncbi:MAG: hypothetical protein Q8Q01_05170 [archaeon]|nr:hypothetical protein [archaeon]
MIYESSMASYYAGNSTPSTHYSSNNTYSRPKRKISCCGRWQGGSRCGSCPNS